MSSVESAHSATSAAARGGPEQGGLASAAARLAGLRSRRAEAARVDSVRAALNLHAVLPNLEDVVALDPEMSELARRQDVSIQFIVGRHPQAWVRLRDGVCTVGRGELGEGSAAAAEAEVQGAPPAGSAAGDAAGGAAAAAVAETGGAAAAAAGAAAPTAVAGTAGAAPGTAAVHAAQEGSADVILWFTSAAHLNKMFDGSGNPVPLKGFKKIGFLKGPFTQLTDRLAHYLKPTDELLADPSYLAMNTRLTLNTAAFAVPILLDGDPDCRHLRHALSSGSIGLKVLPDGPSVGLHLGHDEIRPVKGEISSPTGLVMLRDMETASAYLNGKLDTFAAAAKGEVQIWGQIGAVEALGLVLDRVPKYLS